MKFVHKSIIVLILICIAVGGGSILGQGLGHSFSSMWLKQSQEMSFDDEYQNVIDENLLKLEALEAVPAYQELEGYHGDGVLMQQEEDWKLVLVNKWNEMEEGYVPELTDVGDGHLVDSRIAESLKDMIRAAKKDGYYIYIYLRTVIWKSRLTCTEQKLTNGSMKVTTRKLQRKRQGRLLQCPEPVSITWGLLWIWYQVNILHWMKELKKRKAISGW